ncbi:GNAT family N-acetyltransferase [Pelagibacterium lentulum]|uniref:L-ornithine N(alpha)-acyltransferase n=1 Tax=Pelagibacterium lentulum TaxID=2029865 RepID=A0A916VV05_9HYPH|nr:GNAT family N-acyltransferase [Pelagibacterium lentulum]GGA37858.1 hypothetical protein GCM10011499_04040 [Pelagibacterium lentulum]
MTLLPEARSVSFDAPARDILARIGTLEVRLATSPAQIRAALALRYRVFCEEMGARPTGVLDQYRLETDSFDAQCDHIIVCDKALTGLDGQPLVVGTYRALRPEKAINGHYAQSGFDVAPLLARHAHLRFCELGRSCVAKSHRGKSTLDVLWCGLWAYACLYRIDVFFGSASFPGSDGARHRLSLGLLHNLAVQKDWEVYAHKETEMPMNQTVPRKADTRAALRAMPPLIRGYLKVNAIFGRSAHTDTAFDTTDVMVITRLNAIPAPFRRRFIAVTGRDLVSAQAVKEP